MRKIAVFSSGLVVVYCGLRIKPCLKLLQSIHFAILIDPLYCGDTYTWFKWSGLEIENLNFGHFWPFLVVFKNDPESRTSTTPIVSHYRRPLYGRRGIM